MTAPSIKATRGRPAAEISGSTSDAPPPGFVRTTGDTMTGPLTAPQFIGDGEFLTQLQWGQLEGVPDTIAGFGITDFATEGDLLWVQLVDVGVANGVASLDSSGKVPSSQLPAFSFGNVFTAADETAMLALSTAVPGDLAIRTDVSETFILSASPPSTLGNWIQLLSPSSPVASVFGRTGPVVAEFGDYDWTDLSSIPTDIAGFGLTSDLHTQGDARWLALTGGSLSGGLQVNFTKTLTTPVTNADEEGIGTSIIWNPSGATTNDNPVIGIYGSVGIDGVNQAWGTHKSFVVGGAGAGYSAPTRSADVYGIVGLWGLAQKQNPTGNAHFVNGVLARADVWGGTVDQSVGVDVTVSVGSAGSAATASKLYGEWIHAPIIIHAGSGGGSAYGLYIDDFSAVTGYTNAWAIFVEGGNVSLGGNLSVLGAADVAGDPVATLGVGDARWFPQLDVRVVDYGGTVDRATGTPIVIGANGIGAPDSTHHGGIGAFSFFRWDNSVGSWITPEGGGIQNSTGDANAQLTSDIGIADHEVTAHFENVQDAGIILRSNGNNDCLIIEWVPGVGVQIVALRGTSTRVVLATLPVVSSPRATIRAGMEGSAIDIYINGWVFNRHQLTGTDITRYATGTSCGVYTHNDSDALITYVNLGARNGVITPIGDVIGPNTCRIDTRYVSAGYRPRWEELYGKPKLPVVTVPSSSASAGNPGDIAWDDSFFYVHGSSQWKRAALSTF